MWWIDQQTQAMRVVTGVNKPLAIALLAIALGLMTATVIEFWKHRTTINPMKPSTTSHLVTTGVLKFSRNPIYLGDALLLLAWAIWLNSVISVLTLPLFVAYLSKFQIQPEEAELRSKFTNEYFKYCALVRRWI
jgi:protein-S-isoprenylcysteine O-methyltransferase Ste14